MINVFIIKISITQTWFSRGIGLLEPNEKSLQNICYFNIHMYGITRASNGPKSVNINDYFLYIAYFYMILNIHTE